MRKTVVFGIMILLLSLFACKKDSTDPVPDSVIVHSATISSQGGVLEYDGFTITVPENSFNGMVTLNLSKNASPSIFGPNEAAPFYTLSGLPIQFLEPLGIEISTGTTNQLFGVFGEQTKAPSNAEQGLSYRFKEVASDGKKVSFQIDPLDIPNYDTDDTLEVVIGLVKNYIKTESKELTSLSQKSNQSPEGLKTQAVEAIVSKPLFVVYAPSTLTNESLNLLKYLEEAHSVYKSSVMGFSYAKRTKWPVEVTVRKLDKGVFGYFVPSKWGNNSGYLEFNQDNMKDMEELRLTVGHEFFHLVQALYDSRYGFTKAVSPSVYYWVEEASSVWAEELFSSIPNYCSVNSRNGHQMAPFAGFFKGAEGNAQNQQYHGYGMSALIKYIADKYGSDKLVKVFEEAQKGSTILNAFNNALPVHLYDVYPDFIDQYIQGQVYSDMGPANLLSETAGEFTISAAKDTLKVFESTYPGLSAKVYKIDINYAGFTEEHSLLLKTSAGTKKLIYKLKGGELTLLGSTFGNFNVTDLPSIQKENALLLVVVVHHFYTDLKEKLEVRVNTTQPVNFGGFRFSLKNLTVVEQLIRQGITSTPTNEYYGYTHEDDFYRPGTYSNGTYYATWDETISGWRHKGTIHLIIDEQNQKIISGTIDAIVDASTNSGDNFKRMEIAFSNIPATSWGESVVYFGISGEKFCDKSYVSSFYEANTQLDFVRTMLSYSCKSNTVFSIKLEINKNP
jgi:hypothetical protein